ncbi:MAG: signal peptide peptidase SppA [Deltaproteobacteria bacterium]|nr:signal peptide peptidase SppA [Deltaproteobacteria bacterium]
MKPRPRLPLLLTLALLAGALPARAQVLAPGLRPPATDVALAEGTSDLGLNPAALLFQTGHELRIQYQTDGAGTPESRDAVRVAYGLSRRNLAMALHGSWTDDRMVPRGDERWLGGSLAFGGRAFSVGLSARGLATRDPARARLFAYDFAVGGRPHEHLSYGFSVRDLASRAIDPAYAFGLGTSLLRGRLTLGTSWSWSGTDRIFASSGEVGWTARLRALHGLELLAGGSHRLDGSEGAHRIEVGLRIDLSHLGVAVTGSPVSRRLDTGEQGLTSSLDVRISSARHSSIVSGIGMAVLDLDDLLADGGSLLFGRSRRDRLLELLALLDQARRDREISGVLIRAAGGASLSMAEVEELRAALARLRQSGKKTTFYLEAADDALYYLATGADRILAAPGAVFLVNGLSSTSIYLRRLLDELGIRAEFARIGRYKNAPDTFLEEDISEAEAEVRTSLLGDLSPRYRQAVGAARDLGAERLDALLAEGILGARAALEAGLIDALVYPDELDEQALARQEGAPAGARTRLIHRYGARRHAGHPWGPRTAIAVVEIRGTIVPGETPSSLFDDAASVTGARTFARQMEDARRDPEVAAIVLRIDSGGGDAHASDLMWRAVKLAAKEKPVVASMGSVAASGGYYAAAGADLIVADPSTLTGSIGIFAGHVDLSALFTELGVVVSSLDGAPNARILGFDHGWSESERASMERFVKAGYDLFLDRVAKGRRLSVEEVDALGQGRVWTGAQAHERGLVDELGGFERAVALAKERAGIDPGEVVELDFRGLAGPQLRPFGGEGGPLTLLPENLSAKVKALLPVLELLGSGRALALSPVWVEVR